MTQRIRLALPNQECLPQLVEHLEAVGIDLNGLDETGVIQAPDLLEGCSLELLLLPDGDVGTYVERGVVQMGVASTHLIQERDYDVWRPYTFNFGSFPVVLAARRGQSLASLTARPQLRLATPIPKFTREWFAARGFDVEIIPVERSPRKGVILGLADGFVDRLITPEALTDFDFRALERLGNTSLKLLVNNALAAPTRKAIQAFIELLEANKLTPANPVTIPFDVEDAI